MSEPLEPFDQKKLLRLFSELSPEIQESLVLIGGQAISFWASYFLEGELEGADLAALTSSDLDIVSDDRDSITLIARSWGGSVRFSSMDDNTPNIAVIDLDRPGWSPDGSHLIVDVMGDVYGATAQDLLSWSEMLQIDLDDGNSIRLRVVVPEMLLWTRISNIHSRRLVGKGLEREVRRTKILCRIVNEHLLNYSQEMFFDVSLRRSVLRHAKLVYKWIAVQKTTRQVFSNHPDLMQSFFEAIPNSPFLPKQLFEKGVPGWNNWLEMRVGRILRHRALREREKIRK